MKKLRSLIIIDILIVIAIIIFAIAFKNNDDYAYQLGFIIGFSGTIIIATAVGYYIRNVKNKNYEYDERQIARRGECYKYAVVSLVITLLLDGLIRDVLNYEWSSYIIGVSVNLVIALGVFVMSAIFKDAYFFDDKNKKRIIIIFVGLGIFNAILALYDIANNKFIDDGKVTTSIINLLAGLISIMISVVTLIKKVVDNKLDEE